MVTDHLIQNSSLAIIPNGGRSGFTLVMFLLASSDSVDQENRIRHSIQQDRETLTALTMNGASCDLLLPNW